MSEQKLNQDVPAVLMDAIQTIPAEPEGRGEFHQAIQQVLKMVIEQAGLDSVLGESGYPEPDGLDSLDADIRMIVQKQWQDISSVVQSLGSCFRLFQKSLLAWNAALRIMNDSRHQ